MKISSANKMKLMRLLIMLFISVVGLNTFAQNHPGDCVGALPFCDPVEAGKDRILAEGNVPNEVNSSISCIDHENFSTWYKFNPTSNGTFTFILYPNDDADDFDWAVFDITNSSCDDIPTDPNLLVSCNSWGDFNYNGPTGISSAQGGTGNSNGPGTFNGPQYNEDLQVQAGHNYVLMVSNWSNSNKGFTINTSGSTAQNIYAETTLTTAEDQIICESGDVQVYADFQGTVLDQLLYSWTPADLFVDPNAEDPVLKDVVQGEKEFTVTLSNGGCVYRKGFKVTDGAVTYNKQDKNQNVCIGEVSKLGIQFTGNLLGDALEYVWSPANLLDNPNAARPTTVSLFDSTRFYFQVTNGPCVANDSLMVYVWADTVKAAFDFTFSDNESTIPVEVDFTNNSANDFSTEWYFGDGSDTSTVRSPQQHPYPGYDSYEVTLVSISSSTFCIDTARALIEFPEVTFPNIITPNGDDYNEDLWVIGLRIGSDLRVYDRWGKLVYEQDNYQHTWSAEGLADGQYYFVFTKPDGEQYKGWLEVSR